MQRPRLLVIATHARGTGATRVMRALADELADRYEIDWIGLQHQGLVRRGAWTLHPCKRPSEDPRGLRQAEAFVREHAPDLLLVLNDLDDLEGYAEFLDGIPPTCARVACVGSVAALAESARPARLDGFDQVVVCTRFAAHELERGAQHARRLGEARRLAEFEVIPRGVDRECFHGLPDPERARARRELLGAQEDDFIVLCASSIGSNPGRQAALEGFASFARGKSEKVRLCLLPSKLDSDGEAQVRREIERLGLADRVHWACANRAHVPLDDESLNRLYNACKVGLHTSLDASFGLMSLEHGATGAAQLVPGRGVGSELWQGAGELLPLRESGGTRGFSSSRQVVDEEGVAKALEGLHANPAALRRAGIRAHSRAHERRFDWNLIGNQWDRLLRGVLRQTRARATDSSFTAR